MYILIVILILGQPVAFTQEFGFKESCEKAMEEIKTQMHPRTISVIGCYRK